MLMLLIRECVFFMKIRQRFHTVQKFGNQASHPRLSSYLPNPHVFDVGPNAEKIDLVVTLGGDGTILHASSLFSAGAVPPVLSFSMGTLGFLLPFRK